MPENTKFVGRPTKWGNPFKLTKDGRISVKSTLRSELDPWIIFDDKPGHTNKDLVRLYKHWFEGRLKRKYLPKPPTVEELKGYDCLACFCAPDQPCHVDVLIEKLEKEKVDFTPLEGLTKLQN